MMRDMEESSRWLEDNLSKEETKKRTSGIRWDREGAGWEKLEMCRGRGEHGTFMERRSSI